MPSGAGFKDECITLTETWLDRDVPDSEVSLDNFSILRVDRKSRSGRCLHLQWWCTNIKVHCTVCAPDVDMLTLALRPFYLLREFPTVIIYVPPSANQGNRGCF